MSDASPFGFGRFVPGFDFLQKLSEGATAGMSSMPPLANWVAPTVSVEEIDKRIRELKTVQFWLEQNARALTATVQALEVQRMTLATLQGMNVAMTDLAGAFKSGPATAEPEAAAPASAPAPAPEPAPDPAAADPATEGAAAPAEAQAAVAMPDPLQWWGALTQQFQQIAAKAMGDAGAQQAALAATRDLTSGALQAATEMAATFTPKASAKKTAAPGRKTATKTTKASTRKTAARPAAKRSK